MIETRLCCPSAILFPAPAAQRDHHWSEIERELANTPTDLDAIHAGKSYVAQNDVRSSRLHELETVGARARDADFVALDFKPRGEGVCTVVVVLDDDDVEHRRQIRATLGTRKTVRDHLLRFAHPGQRKRERAPAIYAGARRGKGTAVQLREPLRERQADAQAGIWMRLIDSDEHIEDADEQLGRDANPGVDDPNDRVAALVRQLYPDLATFWRVLRCIVENVPEDLADTRRVDESEHGLTDVDG